MHRLQDERLRRLAAMGLVLFAFALVTSPFEHHDLICHLKTPQHCTSCASNPVGSDPVSLVSPGATPFTEVGRAVAADVVPHSAVVPVRTTGRSPPSLA